MANPKDISAYIKNEPVPVQKLLKKLRGLISHAAPQATEKIAWGMPTYVLEGNLVHFAAFRNHISLFPGSEPIEHFKKVLVRYKTSKGTIQFPLDEPLPEALITKIIKFCVKRNLNDAKAKAERKATKKARRAKVTKRARR